MSIPTAPRWEAISSIEAPTALAANSVSSFKIESSSGIIELLVTLGSEAGVRYGLVRAALRT